MNLSIIIVSWKVRDQLKKNLQAILASQGLQHRLGLTGFSYEIYVVDNNSNDGTVEMVQNEFQQVKLVTNRKNLGFSAGVNQVMREAEGDYVLLLNPDMEVKPDTLSKMLEVLYERPQIALASCKLVDQSGQLVKHVRRFPGLKDQLAIIFKLPHFLPNILKEYLRFDFNYSHSCQVDSIRGSFFMIKKETIKKIGLLDERYFIWFEDVDYCQTVKAKGLETWYIAEAECVDLVGQSFKQIKIFDTQKYFKDSMLKYFAKWYSGREVNILKIAWTIILPCAYLASLVGLKGKAKT